MHDLYTTAKLEILCYTNDESLRTSNRCCTCASTPHYTCVGRAYLHRSPPYSYTMVYCTRIYIDFTIFVFLSGLHWHFSGLSELPLEERLLPLFACTYFPFFFILRKKSLLFPYYFVFVFFLKYRYVRACCRRASSVPQAQHNTAQLAQHKAANQAPGQVYAYQSATTQARSQSWREPACRRAFFLYSRPRFKDAHLTSTPRFKDDIFPKARCPADIQLS